MGTKQATDTGIKPVPESYYQRAGIKAFTPDSFDTISFRDQETRHIASGFIKNDAQATPLLFTANGTFYIPMPMRARYPGYMNYLRNVQDIAGTLTIVMIPGSSPEQPLGHTYPSLQFQSGGPYIPLHTGCSHASRTPGYFSGEINVPAVYESKEIGAPIGAAVFIGVNHRQHDVLVADHVLAQHLIDVPWTLNYRAAEGYDRIPASPESGIINCVTFSVDYFARGVGIYLGFPFTNDSNKLIDVLRNYVADSIEIAWDTDNLSHPALAIPKMGLCKPKITISPVTNLSPFNPAVFVDTIEVYKNIRRLKSNVNVSEKKALEAFSENRLITLLLEQGISVEGGQLHRL